MRVFHEAPLQAAQLNRLFGRLGQGVAADELTAAQRLAHTLKGSSALCGLHAIAHLAHALEALLQGLSGAGKLARPRQERLIEAGDMLEQLIELAQDGGMAPDSLPELIRQLYDSSAEEPRDSAWVDHGPQEEPTSPHGLPAGAVEQPQAAGATVLPMLNVPTSLIDDNLRRCSQINIAIGQLNSQLAGTLERANRLAQQLSLVQSQVYELETLIDTLATPVVVMPSRPSDGRSH